MTTPSARDLLKQAAALKRDKRYDEAVETLRAACAAPDASLLMIEERLRLPMYLQLAGRADDGWRELNQLNVAFVDPASQGIIARQMAVFLGREGRHRDAALHEAWSLFCERDLRIQRGMIRSADDHARRRDEAKATTNNAFLQKLMDFGADRPATGTTPDGNPIRDVGWPTISARLSNGYGAPALHACLAKALSKAHPGFDIAPLVAALADDLAAEPPYDVRVVRERFLRLLPQA